ncbi:MAG: Gfo/Idh/MocA family oxidoreductase [Saprospiraceae bacterium]|nr:Gfo/Idh/MocA family oxidoreductase [Saprospiraceae bacterium]
MSNEYSRRELLKIIGWSLGASAFPFEKLKAHVDQYLSKSPDHHSCNPRGITAITLGAGARGNTYGRYALQNPDQIKIIGVAEPIPLRNERYASKHQIQAENRMVTWEHVFDRPKWADAVIITTPDDLHFGPCMKALEMGYDVLLEKPIAPTEQECRQILERVQKTKRIVAVCHVLRYAPYFIKLKSMIDSGAVGTLVSIQHLEPIEHVHMAHSFVRGNWHDSKKTTPIILAKSCHDLDILRWLVGKNAKSIAAFGGLKWFKKENAPSGSTLRCTDGCKIESDCPYSALKIYHRKRSWTYVFDLPENKEEHGDAILQYLKTTNYGRCVYQMENDQPDHVVSSILFEDGITAGFNMEALTSYGGRRTRVMGSMGDIVGDMEKFIYTDFRTGISTDWDIHVDETGIYKNSGHGSGDFRLMHDWVAAVSRQDASLLTSTIEASIESHLMGFAAEKSRLQKNIQDISF